MDSIHVTNYELNIGLGLRMALVTDMHSMPYDDLLMLLQKEGTKILLCHHPEHYKFKIKDRKTDTFDLVLSEHYHGGQWRIGNVGVYVPRIGLMVSNVRGQFGKHIISAGVLNTTRFPRLGNPRKLVMIKI